MGATNSAIESTTPASQQPRRELGAPLDQQRRHAPLAQRAQRFRGAFRIEPLHALRRRWRVRGRDPQRPCRCKLESLPQPSPAVEHDAQGLAFGRRFQVARVEARIVRERRAAAHGHGVHRGPPDVDELAALGR